MYWIIQFIIRHRNFSSLLVTVIASLLMLNADLARQQAVARVLTISVFYPFQFTVSQAARVRRLFSENKKLREEITALSVKCAQLEEAAAENKRLCGMLGFEENFSHTLLSARVVVREPSHLCRSIVINCGKKHGAALYMPVIHKDGVVGKIIQTLSAISLVQLIRDPTERISVMIKKNREVGILETPDSRNFFIQCRKYAEVSVGDTVVTSGLGGIYPRGLMVGTVVEIRESSDPLFKDLFIFTSVDFFHIDEVFVMKLAPQWASFRSELDSLGYK